MSKTLDISVFAMILKSLHCVTKNERNLEGHARDLRLVRHQATKLMWDSDIKYCNVVSADPSAISLFHGYESACKRGRDAAPLRATCPHIFDVFLYKMLNW